MTTEQKNEVIAKWMGWKQVLNSELWHHESPPIWCTKLQGKLYFDTSWDWLMPVVEKIESLGTRIVIYDNKAHIESHDLANDEQFYGSEGTKIGATYDCVFKFIEWYNANVKEK